MSGMKPELLRIKSWHLKNKEKETDYSTNAKESEQILHSTYFFIFHVTYSFTMQYLTESTEATEDTDCISTKG